MNVEGDHHLRKVRVLHVLDNLGMGGAETWLMELLRYWTVNGADAPQIDFLATGGAASYYDDEAQRYGARVFYLRYSRSRLATFALRFREILRNGRHAAIHDHGDYVSGWHFLLGSGALPPVRVTHVHNPSFQIRHNYGVTLSRRITSQIGKNLVARYCTHVVGTSRQAIDEYGFNTPRFRHIPKLALHCGFDPTPVDNVDAVKKAVRREFGWPEDSKIVLFAGRIDKSPDIGHPQNHKNSGFAVSIGIVAAKLDTRIHMLLAGAWSPAVPVLEDRILRCGLANRIRFIGIRRDLKRLMHGSDVLLFPSRGEGLGMVAVEAQAAGLPVLASTAVPRECVVVPELVRFEPLKRSADEWAAALLAQASQARNLAAANRQVANSPFAIENSARTLLQVYKQGLPV